MTEEVWKVVDECSDYEVSSLGRLRSLKKREPMIMTGALDKDGRRKFTLCLGGGRQITRIISTMVAEAFHGPKPEGTVATHLDGDVSNNRADNLAWRSQRDNILDKLIHGTMPMGSGHPGSRLTEADARFIKLSSERGVDLANRFGVDKSTICDIKKGRTWKHV